jgi:hypothetical protein
MPKKSIRKSKVKSRKPPCKYGYSLRKGYTYTRKSTGKKIKVKSTCIKEKGRKGPARGGPKKSRVIKITHPGSLSDLGYSLSKTASERDLALDKIYKKFGYSTSIKKLNALAVLFMNTNPKYYSKLQRDMNYIRKISQ